MRDYGPAFYPKLKQAFASETEMGDAINKSINYISLRLNRKKQWSERDKLLTLKHLGEPVENMNQYFPDK